MCTIARQCIIAVGGDSKGLHGSRVVESLADGSPLDVDRLIGIRHGERRVIGRWVGQRSATGHGVLAEREACWHFVVTEGEVDLIAIASVINVIVLDTMSVGCDAADVVLGSAAKIMDSHIVASGDAAGVLALRVTKSGGVVTIGNGNAAATDVVERAATDA